jgi:hypothetical protein
LSSLPKRAGFFYFAPPATTTCAAPVKFDRQGGWKKFPRSFILSFTPTQKKCPGHPLFHPHQLCTGATCSHQRTWVEKDGRSPSKVCLSSFLQLTGNTVFGVVLNQKCLFSENRIMLINATNPDRESDGVQREISNSFLGMLFDRPTRVPHFALLKKHRNCYIKSRERKKPADPNMPGINSYRKGAQVL